MPSNPDSRSSPAVGTVVDISQLIGNVQIGAVRAVEAAMRTSMNGQGEIETGEAKIGYTARVPQSPKNGLFIVRVDFAFGLQRVSADAGATTDVAVNVSFELTYRVPDNIATTEEQLAAFANVNGVFNAWPYFREFVHASLSRMGLPPFILPVYRVSPLMQETADKKPKPGSPAATR